MKRFLLCLIAIGGLLLAGSAAQAGHGHFRHGHGHVSHGHVSHGHVNTHIHVQRYAPVITYPSYPSYHYDAVRHYNHVDLVPHYNYVPQVNYGHCHW